MTENPLILVVDDEPFVPRVLELKLGRAGYRVITAPNGLRGLELIAREHPQVVITDISMPGMDGFELCREAQKYRKDHNFLLIVITSRTEREMRQWMDSIPDLIFFEKPLSPRSLLRTVDAYLATGALPRTNVMEKE
jgi:CheY-like chemotaxis protein